jgi:hypothetical protein
MLIGRHELFFIIPPLRRGIVSIGSRRLSHLSSSEQKHPCGKPDTAKTTTQPCTVVRLKKEESHEDDKFESKKDFYFIYENEHSSLERMDEFNGSADNNRRLAGDCDRHRQS